RLHERVGPEAERARGDVDPGGKDLGGHRRVDEEAARDSRRASEAEALDPDLPGLLERDVLQLDAPPRRLLGPRLLRRIRARRGGKALDRREPPDDLGRGLFRAGTATPPVGSAGPRSVGPADGPARRL